MRALVITLCGELQVEIAGRRVDQELSGSRGRLLLAYLALQHPRPVARDELVLALWSEHAPADPRGALSVLLTRIRRAVGASIFEAHSQFALGLPATAVVDLTTALEDGERAQLALSDGSAALALERARAALLLLEQPLLPGLDAPFLDEARQRVDEQRTRTLEVLGEAALSAGPSELRNAERAATTLVACEPYRESGYALLMRCHAAAGNVAEALRTYDRLRATLRDELGIVPSANVRELFDHLLRADEHPAGAQRHAAVRPPPSKALPSALLRPRDAPLCGRDEELAAMLSWWRESGAAVRVCRLSGDAGIGKTRLAAELARHALSDGAHVLYGRCDEDMPVPYQPFVESVRELLSQPGGGAGTCERSVEISELARLVPELRSFADAGLEPPADDPQLRRFRIYESVIALLRGPAADRGLLLVLDDLHWADKPTLALLRHLLRAETGGRLAIVAAHRASDVTARHAVAEALTAARRDPPPAFIALGGLDGDAVTRLVLSVTGEATPEFLRAIRDYTGGNPLFLNEILRDLRASSSAAGRPVEPADLTRAGVPEGVEVVLARRLARLGREVREVLVDAAVIGLEFSLPVLEALEGPEQDPLRSLEVALDAGVIVERDGPDRLAFAHGVVWDAIYGMPSRLRRARIHRRLASLLQVRPDLGGTSAELARHWHAAGEPGPAVEASLEAARSAADVGAFDEALRHYTRALDLWPVAGAHGDRPEADVLEAAAEAARWSGAPERAVELIRRALELQDGDRDVQPRCARLRERLGRYLWEAGSWDASLAAYDEAVRLLAGPPSLGSARALAGEAAALMLRERFADSLVRAGQALDIARAVGARREEGHALNTYGVDLGMSGRLPEGIEALRRALTIAEEVESLEDQCRAYCNLAELLTRAGDPAEAARFGLAGYAFARRHGLERSGAPIVAANAVAALARLGRWDEADALAEESLADGLPGGLSAYLRVVRGELLLLRGDSARARHELAAAEQIIKDSFEPELVIELESARAQLALLDGDLPGARCAIDRGFDVMDSEHDYELTLRLCAVGCRVARAVAERGGANGGWADGLAARARELCATLSARNALLPEGAAFAVTTEAEYASLQGAASSTLWSAAVEAWRGVSNRHATARALLGKAVALAAEDQRDAALDALAAAREIADALGAEPLRLEIDRLEPARARIPG